MSKTHYFYWGFTDSGKNYVNRLSRLNEKVLANFYDNHILKTYTKVKFEKPDNYIYSAFSHY